MFEINLVPDVKYEMIKAQKMRNLVLFVCIAISVAAVGVVLILFGVKGGQDIAMFAQDNNLEEQSNQLNNYEGLDEILTIQGQLNEIATIDSQRMVLSRVFKLLPVLVPQGADTILLSDLSVNLEKNTLSFNGQANAGAEPLIDYRVLEAFKKSVGLTHYDYGKYVTADGEDILAYCISETDDNGATLIENGSYYAIWYKDVKGCDPANPSAGADSVANRDMSLDQKIWRTPQFDEWYNSKNMALDGTITDVEHFVSACVKYNGTAQPDGKVEWENKNDCTLVTEDVKIGSSSNARNGDGELVLRFDAVVTLSPDFFSFQKKHMMAISPTSQNVTDSYIQVSGLFTQEAKVCDENDVDCQNNTTNVNGEKNDR